MSDVTSQTAPRVTSRFDHTSTAMEVIKGVDLTGKTAIVTGGASGLGVETARALASAGAQVVIAVRDIAAGDKVAKAINAEVGAERVSVEVLELGSLASVRDFARRWGDRPLNLLINNAGVMACPQGYTEDGFETQIGVNHLGHFLLTTLLTPSLEAGAPSRLISVSSSTHQHSDVNFDDPHYRTREYSPFPAYGQSKSANALFAVEYDRRYRDKGVRAFSLMPGVIDTNLGRHVGPELSGRLAAQSAEIPPERRIRRKNVEQGAATTIWAATAPELEGHGGLYLEHCNQALPHADTLPLGEGVKPHALNPDSAARLWTWSEAQVRGKA